jgi:hypothetical protein
MAASTDEKKIAILAKLARHRRIGMNYTPIENTLSKLPAHARGDIQAIIEEMHKDGIIEFHKGKECISLNPAALEEITAILDGEIPPYYLEKLR